MEPIITLHNVCKVFEDRVVLKDFSLEIGQGEFVAITGASGKGKSTLLNIIGLLEPFDSGELILMGERDIKPNSKKATYILRNELSYLFQNYALIEEETVKNNLILALKYTKLNKREKNNHIKEALKKVGLSKYEERKIYTLSGGEQQRIAIARIMLKPCNIVLADEPTGSLDEENRELVFKLIQELNNSGKTIIIVSHDQFIVNQCKRIVAL